MTLEQRAKVEQALARLQSKGIILQVPDLSGGSQAPSWADFRVLPSKPIIPSTSAIQEDSGPRWILILVVLAVLVVCGIGAALFYLM